MTGRHAPPFEVRLWARVDKDAPGGCWVWTGALNAEGYGAIGRDGKVVRVHRAVYELIVGPVPSDRPMLDHLCRNRACCNPSHLEPVTPRENWLRGNHRTAIAVRTGRCVRGHDMAKAIVRPNGTRYCRECAYAGNRRRRRAASA